MLLFDAIRKLMRILTRPQPVDYICGADTLPPPLTKPRVLVLAVPDLSPAQKATTESFTACSPLVRSSQRSLSSTLSPLASPDAFNISSVFAIVVSPCLLLNSIHNRYIAANGARDGAFDKQKVQFGAHCNNAQVLNRAENIAHVTRHLPAFVNLARSCTHTD